jgi:beta-N-acetylhexosaminidase
MAGLTEVIGVGEGAVACINAGVDVVLACNDNAAIEASYVGLQQAQAAGQLNPEKVRQALGRIAKMKEKFLGGIAQPELSRIGCAEHKALEAEIAGKAITILREKPGTLPVREAVAVHPIGLEKVDLIPLSQALPVSREPDGAKVHLLIIGDLRRRPELLAELKAKLQANPDSILLALGYPAEAELAPEAKTVLATYSTRPAALRAAAAGLRGEAPAAGRLPLKA